MKYEKPVMDIFRFEAIDIATVSGDEVSDGLNEDANKVPGVW